MLSQRVTICLLLLLQAVFASSLQGKELHRRETLNLWPREHTRQSDFLSDSLTMIQRTQVKILNFLFIYFPPRAVYVPPTSHMCHGPSSDNYMNTCTLQLHCAIQRNLIKLQCRKQHTHHILLKKNFTFL